MFATNWGAWLIGLGAALSGAGSLLTGLAALRKARQEKAQEEAREGP